MLWPAASESWRAWLLTGARRQPVDRRRIRGAHVGLKRMMVEGMQAGPESPYTWKDFSDAMVWHAVGDAVRALPPQDEQLVKLAYFGGSTNEELAAALGITETTVKKRLKDAMERISQHVHHGRNLGRRAASAIVAVFTGKWLHDTGPSLARISSVAGVAALLFGAAPAQHLAPIAPQRPAPGVTTSVPGDPAGDVVVRPAQAARAQGAGAGDSASTAIAMTAPGLPAALGTVQTVPQLTAPVVTVPVVTVPVVTAPVVPVPAVPPLPVVPLPTPSPPPLP